MIESWILVIFQIIPWSGLDPVAVYGVHNSYYECATRQRLVMAAIKELEAYDHVAFCMKE